MNNDYIIKTHTNPREFLNYKKLSNIIIIPFRKKSKILISGYLQHNIPIFKKNKFDYEELFNSQSYKKWLNNNESNYIYNYNYVLNFINHYSLKINFTNKSYNIFNIDNTNIILIDTTNDITDEFFKEIYKIYYNKNINLFKKSDKINSTDKLISNEYKKIFNLSVNDHISIFFYSRRKSFKKSKYRIQSLHRNV